jgi:DNA-binding transcriptional LysR family regulator
MSMHDLPWNLLAAFLAVHRSGSLSGAARSLGLSQPTVRRQIELLEAQIGVPLFVRVPSGLAPLEGSAPLIAEAEAMEAASAAFVRLVSGAAETASGTVRLTCPAVFAVEILPPTLARLRKEHPAIALELSVSNAVENLLRRDADIAVRLARPEQAALVSRKVQAVTFGFFAAPGPMAEMAAGLDWASLCDSGLLIMQDRGRTLEDALAQRGLRSPTRTALRCDDDLAQLAAIRAGLGVGITQTGIARREGLVPVCADLRLEQEVWVVMHEDQRRLRRVRAVFDALASALGDPAPSDRSLA